MNRVIAALHSVDYAAAGLADYGKPGNYFARQIARWSHQCRESTLPITDAMRQLMDWLPEHIPAGDETTLVHGDYRLDNVVLDAADPGRIAAVLDWEMSTLGDPLADLGLLIVYWRQAGDEQRPQCAEDAFHGAPSECPWRGRSWERFHRR